MSLSTVVPAHLIAVPYDSGRRAERMGAVPLALLDAGIAERLMGVVQLVAPRPRIGAPTRLRIAQHGVAAQPGAA